MSDRLYVDINALNQGGLNLDHWSDLANNITRRVRTATEQYGDAGGTGEMGQQFDENYKPGEGKALEFLTLLEDGVGGLAESTLLVAKNFDQTNDDADSATPHE
ncbi:hypothetical protein [Prauserella cavernicola]|uniref:WXG100 family type VII secretion target n=1 Tax=Prauserella cavernicola TaxID=2800127 RepID=A0A934V8I0_9PSEU|nr:hypothetical protein [Prauserella cavernicola]MBK1787783.1 hypothetical protein [Prauserella cavernicola]